MAAVISFLIILMFSLLIVRIFGIALTVTGMPREVARFEVRSAWTGTGFTTSQSERIVRNPVRRRIITVLIILRGAGFVGTVSTLILSFSQIKGDQQDYNLILVFCLGLAMLFFLAKNKTIDTYLSNFIARIIRRHTAFESSSRSFLLNLGGDYTIEEMHIREDNWLVNKTLENLNLSEEGILVLGLDRVGKDFIGIPPEDTTIQVGDNLILYGRSTDISDLEERKSDIKGEQERFKAEQRQKTQQEKQERELHYDEVSKTE